MKNRTSFLILLTVFILSSCVQKNETIEKNISDTIKEKIKLKRQLKTSTASGKMSGFIVGAMPAIMLVIMTVMQKDIMMVLFNETKGHAVLAAVVVLELMAFLAIKKITTVKM